MDGDNVSLPATCYVRQQDVLPVEVMSKARVTIIGVGAIGSMLAVTLAKMGIGTLVIYDGDTVEPHNLPNQWYRPCDLGKPKVEALKGILDAFGSSQVEAYPRNYTAQPLDGLAVCAVDSMDVRMRLWKAAKPMKNLTTWIDGRMGAEVGRILVADPRDISSVQAYEAELYPSREALQAPCTAKATMYCASGLAALMAAKVGKVLLRRPYRRQLTIDFRNALLV